MRVKGPKNKDQDGRIIDDKRIMKYERMCHFMVRKYLPARSLYEASMDYSDLINQCRYEVMMALANFSSEKAMSSFRTKKALDENGNPIILSYKGGKPIYLTVPDVEKRKLEVIRKSKDKATALKKAEESIVYGRLDNYMRRVRWKFSPEQKGGKTVGISSLLSFDFVSPNKVLPQIYFDAVPEKEKLLDILYQEGPEAAKKAFDNLPEDVRLSVLESMESPFMVNGFVSLEEEVNE
jgi:hypothetical protein